MTITTRLFTFFHGKPVGEDQFGNRYFMEKKAVKGRRAKRWVRFSGASFFGELLGGGQPDPSRVPPEWHGWLHYTFDKPPAKRALTQYDWERPPSANMTGTKAAYLPPGHLAKGGQRAASTSDYEAWKP